MVVARTSLWWSLALHGSALTLVCLGCGATFARTPQAPPLVHVDCVDAVEAPQPATVSAPPVEAEVVVPEWSAAHDEPWPDADTEAAAPLPTPAPERAVHEPHLARVAMARVRGAAVPASMPAAMTPVLASTLPSPLATAAAPPVPPPARVLAPLPGHSAPPEYPAAARRRGWHGTTVIAVECDELGAVVNARVVASSGHALLDDAALAAVRAWRFTAGPGTCEQPITFRLAP
jgi:protein TonB